MYMTDDYKQLLTHTQDIKGIFVPVSMIRNLDGDGNAAIIMSQLLFWGTSNTAAQNDGWFFLTAERFTEDTGLSAYVQGRVRKILVSKGLIEEERRGMPARMYFRLCPKQINETVFSLKLDTEASSHPVPETSTEQDPETSRSESKQRVHTLVNNNTPAASVSPSARHANKKEFVSGIERLEQFVTEILNTYPVSASGRKVTEVAARVACAKLGNVRPTATDDQKLEARKLLTSFRKAIINIRMAVDLQIQDPKYIPSFEAFAGINRPHTTIPKYLEWIDWQPPTKKEVPFVV